MADPRMDWADAVMFGVEEDPVLRSVITLVILLDQEPDETTVRERIERMTRLVPKLRQRAVGNPLSLAPPRWEIDPNFDLDYHLRWVSVPNPDGTMRPVFTMAEQMAEGDFDRARPLWEMLLISGLKDGQAAFITKIHHSVTDGIGGLQMAATLFDLDRKGAELGPMPEAPQGTAAGLRGRLKQGMSFEARTTAGDVRSAIGTGTDFVKEAVTDPIGVATSAGEMAASLSRMLAPASEPLSTVFGDRSLSVYFDLIDIPLDDLKKAGKVGRGTLNDAFVAGVAGGLRRYHERHGTIPDALRVNMPVNLRSPADTGKQGNAWVPARFPVPMNEADPAKRIQQLHPVLRQARTEPAAVLTDQVFRLLTMLPRSIATVVAGGLMKGTDFVATNVPGPPIPVYFAGSQILRMLPYAPKAGAAVNCALMSYNGVAQVGVNIDTMSVPNPPELVADLRTGLEEIAALARSADTPTDSRTRAQKPPVEEAPPARKAPAKKSAVKRTAVKKAGKKAATKKSAAKKAPATKSTAPSSKTAAPKATAKKAPAKKAAAKRAPAKKSAPSTS
ncbi:MAG: wax ester/triacylglycerol synthase family O-acyltransferase [Candidatus Nanopelagicales bacterium]